MMSGGSRSQPIEPTRGTGQKGGLQGRPCTSTKSIVWATQKFKTFWHEFCVSSSYGFQFVIGHLC